MSDSAPRRVFSIYVTDLPPAPPSLDPSFRQPVAIPEAQEKKAPTLLVHRSISSTRSIWGMRIPSHIVV
ncbi:hypothetical protein C8J57DRAFT_1531407 [Mycena rebaudengoi]|nr:hypothetical protein C8J57DRAFT_1531407 [Mycena rebaudengoi]